MVERTLGVSAMGWSGVYDGESHGIAVRVAEPVQGADVRLPHVITPVGQNKARAPAGSRRGEGSLPPPRRFSFTLCILFRVTCTSLVNSINYIDEKRPRAHD